MTIPEKLVKKWQALRSGGDAGKINEAYTDKYGTALHLETIRLAMRTGNASDSLFEVMANYYQQKAEMIKEFM